MILVTKAKSKNQKYCFSISYGTNNQENMLSSQEQTEVENLLRSVIVNFNKHETDSRQGTKIISKQHRLPGNSDMQKLHCYL